MDNSFKSALIIDDDPTQIAILTAYFTMRNIPVIQSASNAALALSKVTEGGNDFDLIVSDLLQMPEMDGLEFLRHLSSRKYTGSLVIMSGVEKKPSGSPRKARKNAQAQPDRTHPETPE